MIIRTRLRKKLETSRVAMEMVRSQMTFIAEADKPLIFGDSLARLLKLS